MDAVCPRCGLGGREVHVMETWSGKWHSTCTHAACKDCLQGVAEAQLARCRDEGQVRILCGHEGCQKYLPQALVCHASPNAAGLALQIDRDLGNLQAKYGRMPMVWESATCGVCCNYIGPRIEIPECGHVACENCWAQWMDEQVPTCRSMMEELPFRCFGDGCQTVVCNKLAGLISAEVRALQRDLARRSRLQANPLYPPEVQVNCSQAGCVGLGYLGFDTVMCFMCEHQWDAFTGEAPDEDLPGTIKACPRCAIPIEKNGGCDHMSCTCGYEFWWSTMVPFRRQGAAAAAVPAAPQAQPQPQEQEEEQAEELAEERPLVTAGQPGEGAPAPIPEDLLRTMSAPLCGDLRRDISSVSVMSAPAQWMSAMLAQ